MFTNLKIMLEIKVLFDPKSCRINHKGEFVFDDKLKVKDKSLEHETPMKLNEKDQHSYNVGFAFICGLVMGFGCSLVVVAASLTLIRLF